METKFNFKSQVCTDKNQSERLLALGLKKETADCFLMLVGDLGGAELYTIRFGTPYEGWTEGVIPAWSLGRLLEVMRTKALSQIIPLDNTFDILIEIIEIRIKEGHFNKEYLI
jgi:hypothetical protein